MREWNLTADDPLSLRLAADARLGPTDYADDQIWELTLNGGDPPALALRTTYGLRARDMRLFPCWLAEGPFGEGDAGAPLTNPDEYISRPRLRQFFVNYLALACTPLAGVEALAEYWAPSSHVVAGRFTLTNVSAQTRRLRFRWAGVLRPAEGGQVLAAAKIGDYPFPALTGQTGDLAPVVMLEGQPAADVGPWPTLARALELTPGEAQSVRWVHAARPEARDSLALAREILARDWAPEFARIFALNADLLEIETGDKDWDAALAFAQKVSLACYVGPTAHLPHASFIFTRIPDRGYSRKGDGSDHSWQWDGQVAAEAYVNLPIITPAAPELAKGVIRNYLAVQGPDGFIDWKPGLAGQRNRALCMPLLASIVWRIYEYTEDKAFVAEVYPGLRRFLDVWFSPAHDRDQDGVPEWSHTVQSAFDDCPSFVRWKPWAQGADISQAESPDLAAYLYRACRSLALMAELLGRPGDLPELIRRADTLKSAVEKMWRDETASYHYVDRDHHESAPGQELARGRGDFVAVRNPAPGGEGLPLAAGRFDPSARLLVRILGPRQARPSAWVVIHGRGRWGRRRIETLGPRHFLWYWGMGTASSGKLYREIERIEVRGLSPEFEVTLATVDYRRQDQTLLLPLWAGLPSPERAQALVRQTITDPQRYWRPFGIPNCSAQDPAYDPENRTGSGGVWMMWNTMIGEGLADYGFHAEAGELIRRIMKVMLATLIGEKAFREAYNPDKPEGLGDRDYLWGVAPVHLFLRTVGVRIVSARKVWLSGVNPLPWGVTVRHKGVAVSKAGKAATVVFPSGREVVVNDPSPQWIVDV